MKLRYFQILKLVLIALITFSTLAQESDNAYAIPTYSPIDEKLYEIIVNLDKEYFDAYNNCDMEKQALFYSDNLEFFHDRGGLNTSKQDVLESIKRNICNKITRTLVPGSIEVYPIKDYGAVQIGYHKFYNREEPNAESKPSKFIIIWRQGEAGWKIAKVISLH